MGKKDIAKDKKGGDNMIKNITTLSELKEIVDFMNEHDLEELEMEKEGKKIKLRKRSIVNIDPNAAFSFVNSGVRQKPDFSADTGVSDEVQPDNMCEIKSPMVGTFYRAPSPEAPPYIEVGQRVNKGDIVCIIEAMKLMNEIKSEFSGVVREILIENGEPVEFGQPLFRIEPA